MSAFYRGKLFLCLQQFRNKVIILDLIIRLLEAKVKNLYEHEKPSFPWISPIQLFIFLRLSIKCACTKLFSIVRVSET
jgi:hypothetical protein